jgi:putative tricarboxylic transport membrane protein
MLMDVLANLFQPLALALIVGGLALGQFVGAMPGLTATMALAVLVPVTYYMPISLALVMLGSIYVGAIRGGGIAAILINIPGTPADIATTFDGFPMTQQGRAREALMMSIFASVMGGLIGNVFLLALGYPLAQIALSFGPPELFWLSILGITLMVSVSETSLLKGLISGFLGLLVTAVGVSPLGGDSRFTFGITELAGGVPIIAGLIGLFCIPRILDLPQEAAEAGRAERESYTFSGNIHAIMWRTIKAWFSNAVGVVSSLIGTFIGLLPGAGGNIAGIVAYDQTRRVLVRDARRFGKGDVRGVTAAETANNATVSSSLIPMMTFGVPGSPPAAILLGAILIQGMRPGAELFTKHAEATYTFIGGLFLANLLLLPVGMYLSNAFARVMYLPKDMLAVGIGLLSAVGTLAIRGNVGDMFVMGLLGVVMYFGIKLRFSPAPAVLGIVLGRIAEEGLTQSMMIGTAKGTLLSYFLGRPITVGLMAATALALLGPPLVRWAKRARQRRAGSAPERARRTITPGQLTADRAVSLGLVALAIAVAVEAQTFGQYGRVFPLMVDGFLGALAVVYALVSWVPALTGTQVVAARAEERARLWTAPLLLTGLLGLGLYLFALMPLIGFFPASVLYILGTVTVLRLQRGVLGRRGLAYTLVFALALSGVLHYLFADVLNVHLPPGALV